MRHRQAASRKARLARPRGFFGSACCLSACPLTPRPPSLSPSTRSLCEALKRRINFPSDSPVKIDSATVKPSTGKERLTRALGSNGKKFAAIFGTSGTNSQANTGADDSGEKTHEQTLKYEQPGTMPVRDAPIAIRNAISRRRPLNRTNNRFATLLQAMSKTKATAANSVANAGRKFPLMSSGSVFNVVVNPLSILPEIHRDSSDPAQVMRLALFLRPFPASTALRRAKR